MSRFREKSWFERLFGCEEGNYQTVKEDISCKEEEDGLCYLTGPNKKRFCAGRFEHVSVEELEGRDVPHREHAPTTIEVVKGDVVAFIANPDNNGAVFQVASQFNCLEFINPAITPEAGVERYEYDHTQGPACSIACGPGTVYRNYFVEMPVRDVRGFMQPQQGQTAGRQLDGFDDVSDILMNNDITKGRVDGFFTQKNGYLTASSSQLEEFEKRLDELKAEYSADDKEKPISEVLEENIWNKLKIGVHYDTEVTSTNWGKVVTETPQQRVVQVFASAAAVGYSRSINRKLWQSLATAILDASYRAIFNVALQNTRSNKLFLTFIGGGVFQNSMAWILNAILKAALRHKTAGIQVYLVCYGEVPQGVPEMIRQFKST